jgi:hypothetical protein
MSDDTRFANARADIEAGKAALVDARASVTDILDGGGHTPVDERRMNDIRHLLGKAVTEANSALEALGWFDRLYLDERAAL